MFVRPQDEFQVFDPLKKKHIGTVVAVDDPKGLNRVRATVPGVFEGEITNLPWITKYSSAIGGTSESGSFGSPDIGAKILVSFPFNDVYLPAYEGTIETTSTKKEGDPKYYGFKDKSGNELKIDKESGEVNLTHMSGTTVVIKEDGSVEIHSVKDLKLSADGFGILQEKGSGITTANSHQGVVDLITGVPVTPSTKFFGDI